MAEVQFQHLPIGTRTLVDEEAGGVCGDRMDQDPDMLAGHLNEVLTTQTYVQLLRLRVTAWYLVSPPCSHPLLERVGAVVVEWVPRGLL